MTQERQSVGGAEVQVRNAKQKVGQEGGGELRKVPERSAQCSCHSSAHTCEHVLSFH